MALVVLLGDSIFDNAQYTGGGPDVASQVRNLLPPGWAIATCCWRIHDCQHSRPSAAFAKRGHASCPFCQMWGTRILAQSKWEIC